MFTVLGLALPLIGCGGKTPAVNTPGNSPSFSTSDFGARVDPFYKVRKFHEGMDFSASVGTEVYATGNGTVTDAGRDVEGGYGNEIKIDHGYTYQTVYAHLSRIFVKPGQKILRGQIIGNVGNTGKSTSPHLHYEVRKNGIPLNPIYFFFNDLSPDQFQTILDLSQRPSQTMD